MPTIYISAEARAAIDEVKQQIKSVIGVEVNDSMVIRYLFDMSAVSKEGALAEIMTKTTKVK
jgi:hypothetical protein